MTEAPKAENATPEPAAASEMVERVARAIALDDAQTWDELDVTHAAMFMSFAHAAIAAMREPTARMLGAALTVSCNNYDVWQAMIDEALASASAGSTGEVDAGDAS